MGLFDLTTPTFNIIESWLSQFLTLNLRLAFWAFISALSSTLIFRLFINQQKISFLKTQIKTIQKKLSSHEGDFKELKNIAGKSLKLSFQRMLITFFPAILAMVPIIFLLVFLSASYDYQTPKAGERVNYQVFWEDSDSIGEIIWKDQNNQPIEFIKDTFLWPKTGQKHILLQPDGTKIMAFPSAPVPIIHKKQWWNVFFGNPAGYISEDNIIDHIAFKFKKQKPNTYLDNYVDGWMWPYFLFTFVFSLIFIVVLKVKF